MAKRKYQGKTKKQWDQLYKRYTDDLKYRRGITKLTKKEFKEAWLNRSKGTTVSDLARQTAREDKYASYQRLYSRFEKRGFEMGAELSKKAFEQEYGEYRNVKDLVESQFFVSRKQAENYVKHAQKLGLKDININDFFKENEKSNKFWSEIAALGGWEAAFEY